MRKASISIPPGPRKRVMAGEIVHDPPLSRGIDNLGGQYHVRVFSEQELPGRGCIFCGVCVEQCTHNLYSPHRPNGVFSLEEVAIDEHGRTVSPTTTSADHQLLIKKILHIQEEECCNCKRCVKMCPRRAIEIFESPDYHHIGNRLTDAEVINDIISRTHGQDTVGSSQLGAWESELKNFMVDANIILSPQRDNRAVGNTSNPVELNIAGEVNDLFAAYATSGKFRVARGGGVRNLLLFKAGISPLLRQSLPPASLDFTREQVVEDLLSKYQSRRAKIRKVGWNGFLAEITRELQKRVPPLGIFGLGEKKGLGDYFMEYAQGGIGIVLNIFDWERPVGFYCCSGMTAGMALIRGPIEHSQLGIGVEKADALEDSDRELLSREIEDFIRVFAGRLDAGYQERLSAFANRFYKEPDSVLSGFTKIIPLPPPRPGREEHV